MGEENFTEELINRLLDTISRCRSCMNCYSVCPLVDSTRGFPTQGPYGILRSLYYGIKWDESLTVGDREALGDIVYACTTCSSCEIKCKSSGAGVPIVEIIEDGRKLLVTEGIGPLKNQRIALKSIRSLGNPYGAPAEDRLNWLKDFDKKKKLSTKSALDEGDFELLLYVGCSASYDKNIQNVARCLISLLEETGINYGVLKEEVCCGSPANRAGDKQMFSDISCENLRRFEKQGVKWIVTISPHCYNVFINEYPDSIKGIKIQHYTEFLSDMMDEGRLVPHKEIGEIVTYHDPCYLGKKNNIYEAPRKLLRGIPGIKLVEMKHNRQDSLCCGGGGGRMWAAVEEVTRLSQIRLKEAIKVKASIIATACPWCHIQLGDAIKDTNSEDKIEVKDIAELMADVL